MSDYYFLNKKLEEFLNDKTFEEYKDIIIFVQNGADLKAKIKLLSLLSDYSCDLMYITNLKNRIKNIFRTEESFELYLDNIITFNPKLQYVELSPWNGLDINSDFSLSFKIPVSYDNDEKIYFNNAKKIKDELKEVLRLILIESKTLTG